MVAKPPLVPMSYVVQQLNCRFLHEYRMIFHQPFSFSCIFQKKRARLKRLLWLYGMRDECVRCMCSLLWREINQMTHRMRHTHQKYAQHTSSRREKDQTKRNGTKKEKHTMKI